MGNIAILAGGDSTLLPRDHDVYVGVDGGCLKLLEQGLPLDMDVYDLAEWCCVAELSKRSVEQGSMPVMIPDFVNRRSSVDTESI